MTRSLVWLRFLLGLLLLALAAGACENSEGLTGAAEVPLAVAQAVSADEDMPAPPSSPEPAPQSPPIGEPAAPLPPAPSPTPERPSLTLPPQEIGRGNPNRREMALTFDCGASAAPTPAILSALRAAGVRATFFLTGQWVRQNPDLTREIAAEHEIANHSFTHPDFRRLSDAQILNEMERTEQLVLEVTGHTTRPLWRAPFGSRDTRVLKVVGEAGWPYHIYWTADSGDWRDISPDQVRANIAAAAQNGAIIVQHCGSTQTATVIAQVIADLQEKGFALTTVSDLLRD